MRKLLLAIVLSLVLHSPVQAQQTSITNTVSYAQIIDVIEAWPAVRKTTEEWNKLTPSQKAVFISFMSSMEAAFLAAARAHGTDNCPKAAETNFNIDEEPIIISLEVWARLFGSYSMDIFKDLPLTEALTNVGYQAFTIACEGL